MKEILEKYYMEGLVTKQVHPTLPLSIWNYTPKVQYGEHNNQYKLWDEVTLQCRGLVTDNEGNVVARPFGKFFNMEEKQHTPTEDFEVYEKMDGSLGILFFYEGKWVVATRGSFTSDQAIKAKEILDSKYNVEAIPKGYTTLFEIIYPQNRIVVDYGDEESLVVLGMTNRFDGKEMDYESLKNVHNESGMPVVKRYDGLKDYTFLKNMIADSHEGFVVKFSNGSRMKIKGEEYLRLHKIMTNVSTTAVWEVLSSGGDMEELIKDVPDEFYKKIRAYVQELNYQHYRYSEYAGKIYDYFRYGKYGDREVEPTKKEFAQHLELNKTHPKVKSICFAMWDGKSYDEMIWSYIKPKFEKL